MKLPQPATGRTRQHKKRTAGNAAGGALVIHNIYSVASTKVVVISTV